MAIKIKDVAAKAGVSVSTVSRVLNGGKNVSQETMKNVLKAIDELKYTPSYIARSLVTRNTNMLGVIVSDLTSSFFSTILSSIEKTASLNNYNLLVCNIDENLDKEFRYLNLFEQMRVNGIILMHEKVDEKIRNILEETNIPVIFCSCKVADIDAMSILIDDFSAAYDATKYLLGLGHERIAYIGGDLRDITSGQNRYEGYRKALEKSNVKINEEYIKFGDYKLMTGYKLMAELIKCKPVPSAIFAASDDMAVGALNYLLDHGYKVPEDFSIMGFDGSSMGEIVRPRLTTVQQPINEMGAMAVKVLIDYLNEGTAFMEQIIMKHSILKRESCRKLL